MKYYNILVTLYNQQFGGILCGIVPTTLPIVFEHSIKPQVLQLLILTFICREEKKVLRQARHTFYRE